MVRGLYRGAFRCPFVRLALKIERSCSAGSVSAETVLKHGHGTAHLGEFTGHKCSFVEIGDGSYALPGAAVYEGGETHSIPVLGASA